MVSKHLLLVVLVCCVAVGVSGQEGVVAEVCFQPSETGACRANLPAYFFNTTSGVCECFMFGGCGGKGNIFLTVQECVDTCAVPQHLQDQVEGCQSELTGDVATTELAPLDAGTGAPEAEVTTIIPVVDAQPTDVTQTEEAVTQIPEEIVTSAPVTETQEYVTSTSVVESETTEINPVQDPLTPTEPEVVTSTSVVDSQVTEVSQTQEAGATQTQDIITEVPQAQNEVTEVPQTTTVSQGTASSTPDSTTDSTTDSTSASTSASTSTSTPASTTASTAASTTATATTSTSPSTTASTTASSTASTTASSTASTTATAAANTSPSTTSRPATTTSRPATTSSTTARPARTTSPILTVLGPGAPVRQVQGVVMGSHGSRPGLLALGQPVFPFRPRA